MIRLEGGEVVIARQIAALRDFVNANTVERRADGGALDGAVHLTGVIGELAFAKWANIWPDLSTYPRRGTPDFVIRGVTWDVKATHHRNGALICPLHTTGDAQRYALAIVQATGCSSYAIRFPGWATREELIRPERISDDPKYPTRCYAIEQKDLRDDWNEAAA